MTTLQHTPGPWVIDRSGDNYPKPCIRKNGVIIAWLPDNSAGISPGFVEPARERDEANANLVAAAPSTLEALREAATALAHADLPDHARRARVAIDKASSGEAEANDAGLEQLRWLAEQVAITDGHDMSPGERLDWLQEQARAAIAASQGR